MDYDKLIAPAAREMRPSGIRKFFDLAADMPECISLGVGEPDFKTPWAVREAGIESLEHGRTRYTANAGLKELRAEICRYLERRMLNDAVAVPLFAQQKRLLIAPGIQNLIFDPFGPVLDLTYTTKE